MAVSLKESPAGDDVVVHPFECGDGLALLFADAQLIAGDVIVLDESAGGTGAWAS